MSKGQKYTEEQREAQRARVRAHYAANKQYYLDKAKKRNEAQREVIRELVTGYLATHPCVDCGFSDRRALQFDHVRGKKLFNIADGVKNFKSVKQVEDEISKCEVRCANCHSIVTYERRTA